MYTPNAKDRTLALQLLAEVVREDAELHYGRDLVTQCEIVATLQDIQVGRHRVPGITFSGIFALAPYHHLF